MTTKQVLRKFLSKKIDGTTETITNERIEKELLAVEKAMGELRKRIVEGQRNFRTHNMNKDANTLDVVITEIDARWPKAKEGKE